jgi:signal transduction histidine kinase
MWYAGILSVGLAIFGGLVWFSLRHRLVSEIDRDLADRASRFEKYFRAESAEAAASELAGIDSLRDELEEFCQALPPGSYISLRGALPKGGAFTFQYPSHGSTPGGSTPGESTQSTPDESSLARATGSDFRALRREFKVGGEAFDLEARAPMDGVLHTLDLLRLLLVSLIPVVIAIACVGGAWLSGRALKPVHDITAAALTISIENLSGRLPVPDTGDELARLSQVLNTMLARLESAVQTLAQFVADASHELRTPLAVIRTGAELALRRSRPAEAYRDALQEIAAEAERMTRLVEDLLILARNDTGTAEMPLAPVDAREIAAEVCAEMRGLGELRQIQVTTSLGDGAATIAGNRPALHRLFLVLLDNALKFSAPGGEVIVAVEAGASRVIVSIQDFGIGIATEDLPHIFKRFYRADQSRGGAGYGLGLSLAQSIARAHSAKIEARSTGGVSTIFEVMFPAREEMPALNAEEVAEKAPWQAKPPAPPRMSS